MLPRKPESNAASNLPADDGIPALRASRRNELIGFLARCGLPEDHRRIQVLKHHRGSRCTMRVWSDRSSLLVKAYAQDPSDIAGVYRLLDERGLGTGRPPTASPFRGYDPSLHVIGLGWLEGLGGKTLLERGGGHLAGKLAAQWLLASRELDFDRAPVYEPATVVSWGRKWVGLLEPQQSDIGRRMRGICDLLEARPPRLWPESLRHGSYSASHVIDLGGGPGIVDWDSFRRGRLELDAGHYLAYLSRFAGGRTRLSDDCRSAAVSFRSSLEGAVENSDLAWFKAAALVRLAWYLCRRKPSRWAKRATALLEEARRDLTRSGE
jgi:hypothetical protein